MKLLFSTLLLGLSAPAFAADPTCEFHVWPAHATGAVTARALSNFGPVGAYLDYRSNRDATLHDQVTLIETLTPPQQAQAMIAVNLPHLLGMGQVRLIFESGSFDPRAAPRQRNRMTDSTAPCYAELIVSRNEYRNSAVRGASLKSEMTFKDFRRGAARIKSASEASGLSHFPARTADKESLAKQDVSDAFAANLRAFARRVARQPR